MNDLISQFIEKIDYGTDSGLNIEIKDFFRGCQELENYSISLTEDRRYKISGKLKNFNLNEAKRVFSAFVRFVEYSAGSFYTRESMEGLIKYNLISFKEDLKGFCCEIEFLL